MPTSKRRKTGKSSGSVSGSRSSSRAASPVHDSRSQSPVPTIPATNHSKAETEKESTPPLILPSVKRRGEYECDYCHTDISQAPRIRCAECPDFDLCLECFLTTDHSAAIARLRASVEARTLVENINAGGPHVQHQGKQAPIGSSAGGSQDSGAASSVVMESGLGALNHDDTHGYRVCDK